MLCTNLFWWSDPFNDQVTFEEHEFSIEEELLAQGYESQSLNFEEIATILNELKHRWRGLMPKQVKKSAPKPELQDFLLEPPSLL